MILGPPLSIERNVMLQQNNMSSSDSATRSLPVLSLRAAEIASAAAQKKAQEIGIGNSTFNISSATQTTDH
jgi:hypothetical protein